MLFGRFLSPPTDAARSASTSSFVPRSEYYRLLSDGTGEKVNNIACRRKSAPSNLEQSLTHLLHFRSRWGRAKKVEKRDLMERHDWNIK